MKLKLSNEFRSVQFRWSQGYLNASGQLMAPHWAIQGIYIGSQCTGICNGHGRCNQDGTCVCDSGYHGDACEHLQVPNPEELHETFEGTILTISFQFGSTQLDYQVPRWTRPMKMRRS